MTDPAREALIKELQNGIRGSQAERHTPIHPDTISLLERIEETMQKAVAALLEAQPPGDAEREELANYLEEFVSDQSQSLENDIWIDEEKGNRIVEILRSPAGAGKVTEEELALLHAGDMSAEEQMALADKFDVAQRPMDAEREKQIAERVSERVAQKDHEILAMRMAHEQRVGELEREIAEHKASFDLRWNADMRAIKRWQEATGEKLVWPDHADLCVWLLEQDALLRSPAGAGKVTDEAECEGYFCIDCNGTGADEYNNACPVCNKDAKSECDAQEIANLAERLSQRTAKRYPDSDVIISGSEDKDALRAAHLLLAMEPENLARAIWTVTEGKYDKLLTGRSNRPIKWEKEGSRNSGIYLDLAHSIISAAQRPMDGEAQDNG